MELLVKGGGTIWIDAITDHSTIGSKVSSGAENGERLDQQVSEYQSVSLGYGSERTASKGGVRGASPPSALVGVVQSRGR